MSEQKVYRDSLNIHRGDYYVTYKPADLRTPFAVVQLTFPRQVGDVEIVKQAMERELEYWLNQYLVPVMITSFDAKENIVHISDVDNESHLIGYVNQQTGQIVKSWRFLKNDELPAEQMEAKYLEKVYKGIPFRRQEVVRLEAYRKAKSTGRAIRLIVFFIVGAPVLIEIISLGVDWVGHLFAGISISVGLYKFGKAMGWIKPNQRDQEKAEKNLKMEHYYYHCEKNPEAFNRLKIENFERETIENTLKEEETIRKTSDKSN